MILLYAQKAGLYRKQRGSLIRYARPLQQRLGFLIFAASLVWMGLWWPFSVYWFYSLCLFCAAVLCIYLAGPNEVHIDLDRRTYRAQRGWPLWPKYWSGPLTDISGVVVSQNNQSYTWMVVMHWKTGRRKIVLGQFSKQAKAEAAAAQVIESLGIDVPAPDVPTSSLARSV